MMRDETLALINATRVKMGVSQISNSTHRWFSERSIVTSAWAFYGSSGNLDTSGVYFAFQVGAVTLLEIKK